MPKGKDLDLERSSSSKALPDGRKQRENDREHGSRKLSSWPDKFNRLNQYRVFGRDSYTVTNSLGQSDTYSYQVMFGTDLSFSGSGWLTGLSVEIKDSSTLTWTSVYNSTITDTNTQLDALQITGPPCVGSPCNPSYSGPGEFDVYQDNIYGTFMFWPVN